ncbi:cation transporter [Elysia marginata]|uniref:Cation transporter n=1 Tax=Elysia marginata TaxID=1093978 RepID=A0AAV4FQ85_9GAST|nr:cation transporter [Elysia marginata]
MPHSGNQVNLNYLKMLDMAVTSIPEVSSVVGKAGRVESTLDPAPMSMFENIIHYKSEYKTDQNGRKITFSVDKNGEFIKNKNGALIPDEEGKYFRQWRPHIKNPDDIWKEIVKVSQFPGLTSPPKLQPIETRLIMLQTGMRAPMGIKIQGDDLKVIEAFGLALENHLKNVEEIETASIFSDRIVGKPYLLIDIHRHKIARYGLSIAQVQKQIQTLIGGMPLTTLIHKRERYKVRVRYPRELRNKAAYHILLVNYTFEGTRFDEILQLQKQLLDLKLKRITSKIQTHIAKAGIEKLIDY